MKKLSLVLTIVSYALGGIAWLLGLLTVVFNVCGLWGPWHLAGFAFIFYCFIPVVPHIASFVVSFFTGDKKAKYITFLLGGNKKRSLPLRGATGPNISKVIFI